jgi:hypothetical protein
MITVHTNETDNEIETFKRVKIIYQNGLSGLDMFLAPENVIDELKKFECSMKMQQYLYDVADRIFNLPLIEERKIDSYFDYVFDAREAEKKVLQKYFKTEVKSSITHI